MTHVACLAVLVGCGVAVTGCSSAVEAFRSVAGHNRNDPDPVEAPFTGNMAAAETAPYPNLASVPPPPTRATTAAERQRLTEKLIAERSAMQAAGASAAASPTAAKAAAPASASPPVAAKEAPPAPASAPPPAPTRVAAATPPPPIAANATVPAPASAPPPAPAPPAAPPQPAPPPAAETGGSRRSATGAPDQPLPRDSDLQMPQVRSLPEPDTHRPAPPPPRLRPVPPPASPGELPPAAIASATPQPAPPIPEFAPIAPPPAPSIAKTEVPRGSGATTVAMVDALDSGQLDPAQITQVASRYRERLEAQPPLRAVRVIAYTAAPAPGVDPLSGYHDALERAQGIAKVLAEAGIPEKMIQTEARPAPGPIAASRIEIQFLP